MTDEQIAAAEAEIAALFDRANALTEAAAELEHEADRLRAQLTMAYFGPHPRPGLFECYFDDDLLFGALLGFSRV